MVIVTYKKQYISGILKDLMMPAQDIRFPTMTSATIFMDDTSIRINDNGEKYKVIIVDQKTTE